MKPALVFIVACAPFVASWDGDWVYDDRLNFSENARFRDGEAGWIFTEYEGHYIPVTWLTLYANRAISGLDPFGYHVTNVVWHGANAVLFYLFTAAFLRRVGAESGWAAVGAALFWAVHPLRVESVAWITERRDLVSGTFFLLTCLCWLRGGRWTIGAAVCFVLSLLAKTMTMPLPFVLLMLEFWPLRRRAWRPIAALIVPAMAAAVLTVLSQREGDTMDLTYPLSASLTQPGYRFMFYLSKLAMPFPLLPLYIYRPGVEALHIVCGAAALAGTILLWRWRAVWTAWVAYGVLMSPVIGIVQAGPHFAADRYTYLAMMPWAVLAGAGLARLRTLPSAAIVAAVLAGFAGLSAWQCRVWKDEVTLWSWVIHHDPNSFALCNRGLLLDGDAARRDFEAAVQENHTDARAWACRGMARKERGDLVGAFEDFSEALRLKPNDAASWFNRGVVRRIFNDAGGAIADYTRAIEIKPDYMRAHHNRGTLYAELGRLDEAHADASRAIELDPGFAAAWYVRGVVRAGLQDAAGARADLRRALELGLEERLRPSALQTLEELP